jgi:transcriptional regulator of aromatic amino acid metabolism
MEEDADALPMALDAMVEELRGQLSTASVDSLLLDTISELAARFDAKILQNYYDRVIIRHSRFSTWTSNRALVKKHQ